MPGSDLHMPHKPRLQALLIPGCKASLSSDLGDQSEEFGGWRCIIQVELEAEPGCNDWVLEMKGWDWEVGWNGCGIGLGVLCVREFDPSVEIWAKLDCWSWAWS